MALTNLNSTQNFKWIKKKHEESSILSGFMSSKFVLFITMVLTYCVLFAPKSFKEKL